MHVRAVRAGRSAASGGRQHATLREAASFTTLKNHLKGVGLDRGVEPFARVSEGELERTIGHAAFQVVGGDEMHSNFRIFVPQCIQARMDSREQGVLHGRIRDVCDTTHATHASSGLCAKTDHKKTMTTPTLLHDEIVYAHVPFHIEARCCCSAIAMARSMVTRCAIVGLRNACSLVKASCTAVPVLMKAKATARLLRAEAASSHASDPQPKLSTALLRLRGRKQTVDRAVDRGIGLCVWSGP